ncbi:MAG: hypothetical protein LUG12_07955 [Erysipelotrichaceae bacterium]|nr:hypothetical protein [Erysipelotrichaceae bacterium]
MKLKEIIDTVSAKEIYIDDPHVYDIEFNDAFGTDLMSDALCTLRDCDETSLLISGLANMQLFHTANTLDLPVVLIVRGKNVDDYMINGAKMGGISILSTDYSMYETCGLLYEAGLGKDA